jgi:TRAP-type C4-dicarboxylate transport system substrate-binding protein
MLTNHSTVINFLCVNTKLLEGMPAALQKIIADGGKYAQGFMFSEVPEIERRGLESLKATGKIEIVEGSPSISEAYKKAAEDAKKEYFKSVGEARGRELLDSLEAVTSKIN